MIANAKKHLWYYVSFAIIQLLGLLLVLLVAYDKQLQLMAIFITTIFYILWSLAHQYIHHHLNVKIATEYILIGALGLTISFVFFGA